MTCLFFHASMILFIFNDSRTETCPLCSNCAEVIQWPWWIKFYASFNFSIYKVPFWDMLWWKLYERHILTLEQTKDSYHWDESVMFSHCEVLSAVAQRSELFVVIIHYFKVNNNLCDHIHMTNTACLCSFHIVMAKKLELFKFTVQ